MKETTEINLTPDPANPNRMDAETKAMMAKSLAEFGDLGGIVLNRRTGLLVGGHQRADVLRDGKLTVTDLPKPEPDGTVARGHLEHLGRRYAVRVVDWSPERAHAALLAANRFGRLGQDDAALLKDLLEQLDCGQQTDTGQLLADLTGFDAAERERLANQVHQDNTYTNKIVAPVYEPKGDKPPVSALYDHTKTDELLAGIDAAGLPEDVARFMRLAAERHTVFNFRQIAEFYCHADAKLQDLMERSGLVIIDFKKAIEYGFVHLTEQLGELADLEEADNGDA